LDGEEKFIVSEMNNRVWRTEIFVNLGETNATGNVYFSNYFKYQGKCREDLLLKHVPNVSEIMMTTGERLITIDSYNKFIESAYFGDYIIGETRVGEIKASSARLDIKFVNKKTGRILGDGYQRFCCANAQGKVIRLPEWFDFLQFYNEVS